MHLILNQDYESSNLFASIGGIYEEEKITIQRDRQQSFRQRMYLSQLQKESPKNEGNERQRTG